MTLEGIDALNPPPSATIKAAGKSFVMRYTKDATRAELAADRAAGIETGLVFETTGTDFTGGWAQGAADAKLCQQQLASLGVPNAPAYFAIDQGTTDFAGVIAYFQGICATLGKPRVGAYGSDAVVTAVMNAGAATYFWQTYAWSSGMLNPKVHLYQYDNGQSIGGYGVDFTRTIASDVDFGQIKWGAPQEADVKLGIFEFKVVAGPYAGQIGQFLSNGMQFRWIPPDFTAPDGTVVSPLADITQSTGPWFNGGAPVETWGNGPVDDLFAFGLPLDPQAAEMTGQPYPYAAPAVGGLTDAQAQQLADLAAAVGRIEAAFKGA